MFEKTSRLESFLDNLTCCHLQLHPRKLTWNPKIAGLGRCFSFSFRGYFQGSFRRSFVGGVCFHDVNDVLSFATPTTPKPQKT